MAINTSKVTINSLSPQYCNKLHVASIQKYDLCLIGASGADLDGLVTSTVRRIGLINKGGLK